MTDLLRRPGDSPSPRSRNAPTAGPGPERRGTGSQEPLARPLTVSAAVAGLGSAVGTLLFCMALAVLGWFLADAGAHGQTTDALGVGAAAWLAGHGAHLSLSGTPLGIVPLGLTVLFAVVAYRSGRWAGETSQPVEDDRSLAVGVTVSTGLYVVLTVVTAVLVGDRAGVGLGRPLIGALAVSGLAGGLGMAVGTGRLSAWLPVAPRWLRAGLEAMTSVLLLLLTAAAVVVAASLVVHLDDAATVISGLHLSVGDALMLSVVVAAVAPNAVLLGCSYLLGPGFAVGTGTVVSATTVTLGPLPAFPLLAALPSPGAQPWWTSVLLAVPALAAALGVARAQRRHPVLAWDLGALRGAVSGFGAAVVLTGLVALAAGPLGTGRMADIGPAVGEVFVFASAALTLGGLIGGLVATGWQRRHDGQPAQPDQADDPEGPDESGRSGRSRVAASPEAPASLPG